MQQYGIYAVLGNHDYVLRNRNLQKLIDTLESYNCKVLQNENDVILVDGTRSILLASMTLVQKEAI